MNISNRYKCTFCNRDYKHKHHLTFHLKKCINNPINISISNIDNNGIDNLIKKLSRLKRDNLSKIKKKDSERYECPFCKKSYKQKSHMTRHMRYRCKVFNKKETKSNTCPHNDTKSHSKIENCPDKLDKFHDSSKNNENLSVTVGDYSMTVCDSEGKIRDSSVTFHDSEGKIRDLSMTFHDSEKRESDSYYDNSTNDDISNKSYDENEFLEETTKKYECSECKKKFKKKKYLDEHLKKYCKMNIHFNNIYKFNKSTFGRKKYGLNGGDIYIIQTDHNYNDIYKIGKTTNLYNKLKDYRCGSVIEPRLYFYYPFKNIKIADSLLKKILSNYNLKREIYNCDLNKIRKEITKIQKKLDNCEIENEPLIKQTDLSECKFCEKIFYTKNKMFEHLNICKDYQESFNTKKEFYCKYCNLGFVHKNSLYRHMKHYCKKKESEIFSDSDNSDNENVEKLLAKVKAAEKKIEVETLKKKLAEAEKQIDKLKMSQHVTYNNNITVIAYNKQPDLNHLKDSDYLKIMNRGFKSVPKLIEAVHFNPNKPENHNVYIPNIKNNYAKTWNGNKWDLHNQEELIEDMYDDNSNKLLEKLEEMECNNVNLKESILRKFKRFADMKDDNIIKKKIKEEIKLILYNNKSVIGTENKLT
jgi:transposase-like protein